MNTRPLIISPIVQQRIKHVVDYANKHVYTIDDLLDRHNKQAPVPGDVGGHIVNIDFGYKVVFSIEEQPSVGRCKHISISVDAPGALPSIPATKLILESFGITWDLSHLVVNVVEIDKNYSCIDIIEPPN